MAGIFEDSVVIKIAKKYRRRLNQRIRVLTYLIHNLNTILSKNEDWSPHGLIVISVDLPNFLPGPHTSSRCQFSAAYEPASWLVFALGNLVFRVCNKPRHTALGLHFIRTHHTFPSAVTPRVNVAMASSLATHQFAGVQAQFK